MDNLNPMNWFGFFFLQLSSEMNVLKKGSTKLVVRLRPELLQMCKQAVPVNCEAMTIGKMEEKFGEMAADATLSELHSTFCVRKFPMKMRSLLLRSRRKDYAVGQRRSRDDKIEEPDYTMQTVRPLAKSIRELKALCNLHSNHSSLLSRQ
jgi:hypothetical protein